MRLYNAFTAVGAGLTVLVYALLPGDMHYGVAAGIGLAIVSFSFALQYLVLSAVKAINRGSNTLK